MEIIFLGEWLILLRELFVFYDFLELFVYEKLFVSWGSYVIFFRLRKDLGFFYFLGWLEIGLKFREYLKVKLGFLVEVLNLGVGSLVGGGWRDRKNVFNISNFWFISIFFRF